MFTVSHAGALLEGLDKTRNLSIRLAGIRTDKAGTSKTINTTRNTVISNYHIFINILITVYSRI